MPLILRMPLCGEFSRACIHVHVYVHFHTYTHKIHACIPTYLRSLSKPLTFRMTLVFEALTCLHTCVCTCIHTYMHTYCAACLPQ